MPGLVLILVVTIALALLSGQALVRMGFPMPEGNRERSIDGLRGILAISVLCHHAYIWSRVAFDGWREPTPALANQLGAGAVGLFFMITGFLFYRTILTLSPGKWVLMMVGRAFRILPLVTVSFLFVVAIVILRSHPPIKLSLLTAAANWISAKHEVDILGYADSGRINAYVLWSLWQEWLFYALLVPLLGAAAWAMRLAKLPTVLLPLGLIGLGFSIQMLSPRALQMPLYFPLFGAGMLAYELAQTGLAPVLRRRSTGAVAIALLALTMTVAKTPYWFGLPAFAFFFACVASGNTLGGVLSLPAARALGECSFGVYLFHGIALSVVFVDMGVEPTMTAAPAIAIIVVAVAAAMHVAIEKPMVDLHRTLRARWRVTKRPASLMDSTSCRGITGR